MEKVFKACQSCGMPFRNDPKGGGTHANGSKSTMYCSHCYQQGKFTQPNITLIEMQAQVKDILKKMPFHFLFAGFFVKGIAKLERWRNVA